MKRFQVRIQPAAESHLEEIRAWWREHRPEHPELVAEELADAVVELAGNPEAGSSVTSRRYRGVRRLLLLRSQYFVYYRVDRERRLVRIEAVWRTSRGKGPPLR